MALDWKSVKAEHVAKACQIVASGGATPKARSKGIFVLHGDKRLPAKHILRVAYCFANGMPIDSMVKFSSGEGTTNRLRALGFEVEHLKGLPAQRMDGQNS